jgi:hypothetical protein
MFFGPQSTTTFIKMRKKADAAVAPKPFGAAYPIDLGDTSARDQFQIICYENNNIALFAETVVLVEGDSDYIVLPYLARVLNPAWDFGQVPIRFARIGGKGNIRRYKQFFNRFQMRVVVVTDLDFLLGTEFGQIDPSADLKSQRDQLLAAVDDVIKNKGGTPEPNAERTKAAQEKGDLRALWRKAREVHAKYKAGQGSLEEVTNAVDEFFAWEKYWGRRDMLRLCPTQQLAAQKRDLIDRLRGHGVCVLEKGSIEDYYPADVTGDSKPIKALCFCNVVTTKEQALTLCGCEHKGTGEVTISEFEAIFQTIFAPSGFIGYGEQ